MRQHASWVHGFRRGLLGVAGSHPSLTYSDFCDRTLAVPEAKVTILQCFTRGACAGSPHGTLEAMEPAGWMHGLRGSCWGGWQPTQPNFFSVMRI